MNWFERRIRRYEHRRWTTDDNRRVQPFHWGVEHIGGSPDEPDPGAFVRRYAQDAIESSREWYAASPADDYYLMSVAWRSQMKRKVSSPLLVPSNLPGPKTTPSTPSFFRGRCKAPPSSFSPIGTPKWHGQNGLCHWIQRMGITVLKMSMPYHDRRMAHGHERADQICGPNIGLTLQANRQAVQDARRCLHWLEQQGYTKLVSWAPASAPPSAISLWFTMNGPRRWAFPCLHLLRDVVSQA